MITSCGPPHCSERDGTPLKTWYQCGIGSPQKISRDRPWLGQFRHQLRRIGKARSVRRSRGQAPWRRRQLVGVTMRTNRCHPWRGRRSLPHLRGAYDRAAQRTSLRKALPGSRRWRTRPFGEQRVVTCAPFPVRLAPIESGDDPRNRDRPPWHCHRCRQPAKSAVRLASRVIDSRRCGPKYDVMSKPGRSAIGSLSPKP